MAEAMQQWPIGRQSVGGLSCVFNTLDFKSAPRTPVIIEMSTTVMPAATDSNMYVVTRSGKQDPVSFDKITERISSLCNGEAIQCEPLSQKVRIRHSHRLQQWMPHCTARASCAAQGGHCLPGRGRR
eukprot:COSAG05_NODE_7292_length_832_cov_0.984993_2_plen_127_part_00